MLNASASPFPSISAHRWQQLAYAFIAIAWCVRWWQGVWLYQLQNPLFISPYSDNTFWIFHSLNVPQMLLRYSVLGGLVDAILFISSIWASIQTSSRWASWFVFMGLFVYFITYNSALTHHTHNLIALVFTAAILINKDVIKFSTWVHYLRWYACFAMASAAWWKLGRSSAWHWEQMSFILQTQHAQYLTGSAISNYWKQSIIWLISNPAYSFALWCAGWGLELIFTIGLFSRRWDKWLVILLIAFFAMDYILMNLYFVEFCLFGLAFVPVQTKSAASEETAPYSSKK